MEQGMSKSKKMTTPRGTAVWPKLNEADKTFEPKGVFSTEVRLSAEDSAPMIEELTKILEDYYAEAVKKEKKKLKRADLPWKAVTDDSGKETGEFSFRFKMTARIDTEDGKTIEQRPVLFDAKMRPMSDRVGGGSIVRVGFEPHPWFVPALGVGMSLRLKAVQVIELRQFAPKTGKDFGFSSEEGFETAFTEEAETKDDGGVEPESASQF
jgi:hypothetical protein